MILKEGCQKSKRQNLSIQNLNTKILSARILNTTWAKSKTWTFCKIKNKGEEGLEKGEEEVDMVQILDIVQELSGDPIFLSLSHDLMHKTATNIVVW